MIDLVLISSAFKNVEIGKRYSIVRELLPVKISAELLLYTSEEFEKIRKKRYNPARCDGILG